MVHLRRRYVFLLFYLLSTSRVLSGADALLVEQLLDYYSPIPHWALALAEHTPVGDPLPEMPSIHRAPIDSAPVTKHLAYWGYSRSWSDDHEPTPAVRQKVLEAVLQSPVMLPNALDLLPSNESAVRQVAGVLDAMPQTGSDAASDLRDVRAWVFENSGMLREEVMADVVASLDDKYGWADSASMQTLWEVDTAAAALVCREMTESDEWKQRVIGAKHLWEHGDTSGDWRALLVGAAGNPACPNEVRDAASRTLLKYATPERTEWMLKTLQFAQEWYRIGFENSVRENPDFWIPKLIPFVDGSNRLAHERAVALLVQFNLDRVRVDALRPLLPWLSNPDWASGKMGRLRLVQSLDRISLPESVDGLIYVIEHDSDEWLCRGAAEALASYDTQQALPALKAAFERLGQYQIFVVIDQMNGYSTAEQLAFIEAYYQLIPEAARPKFYNDPLAEQIDDVPGDFYIYALQSAPREALFLALIEKSKAVAESDPGLAQFLDAVALDAYCAREPDFLAQSLREEKVSAIQLTGALEHCASETWNAEPFASLAQLPGAIGGCAAVLSRDPNIVTEVLSRDDAQAHAAVFAAARISGDTLPLDEITGVLNRSSDNKMVRDSALAYLDSRQEEVTRQLYAEVRDRYMREGLLEDVYDSDLYFEIRLNALAGELRHRFDIQEEPLEVYGLLSSGTWGGAGQQYLLVFPDQCLAVQDFDGGRMGIATVSDTQIALFKAYIEDYRIDSLPPLTLSIYDGVQYNYIHHDGVRLQSVFMNNPPTSVNSMGASMEDPASAGIVLYACLMRHFIDLFEGLDFKLSYGSQLAIILPSEQGKVQHAWANGDDVRVLIEHSYDAVAWQGLDVATGELTGVVAEPAACAMSAVTADMHPDFKFSDYHLRHPSQVRSGEVYVRSGTFRGELGLWLCQVGMAPELLVAGRFLGESVSSDGKWCAVPQALGQSWAEPNTIVLIDLETREQYPIDLEPADTLNVVCYLPSHAQFLVYRARDQAAPGIEPNAGPEYPEYYLLDPESRVSQPIVGDLDVLASHQSLRPLQPVAGSDGDLVWGAEIQSMPNGGLMTVVGRYDRHHFKFEPVLEVAGFMFESTDMWVDADVGMIYIVLNEDLVRMPVDL